MNKSESVIDPNLIKNNMEEEPKEIESSDRYNTDIVKGIFLLTLVASSNFVGETLGCQAEKAMAQNMYVKHAILLLLIYFTINFTASDNPHPIDMVKKTFIVWIMYLMFAKMNGGFTLAAIILLVVYYILSNFTNYYTNIYKKKIEDATNLSDKKELEQDFYLVEKQYQDLREYTLYVLIIIVILGFVLYAREKWEEYYDDFSYTKFIFGTGSCKGLAEKSTE